MLARHDSLESGLSGEWTTPPGVGEAEITYGVLTYYNRDWNVGDTFTVRVVDGELDLGDLDLADPPRAPGGVVRLTARHLGESPPGGRSFDNADPIGGRTLALLVDPDGSIEVQLTSQLNLSGTVANGIWGAEYLSATSADLADPRGPALLTAGPAFSDLPRWALEIARELCDVPALPGVNETVEKSILVELGTRRIVEASGSDGP
ncbi:MAG: hypothetical protein EA350_15665 [Gemmatimonadales bacterium]|nr:MAG: hypothetical protein EA350_15665 [Gemmatimonadales bacterium]